jgi:hypothetical protein
LFARDLAETMNADKELAFAGAMLQDFLLPILTSELLDFYVAFSEKSQRGSLSLAAYERQTWGWDHALAAGRFMLDWQFPDDLICCVLYHHQGLDILSDPALGRTALGPTSIPFAATRPLTTASLVAAKLKMSILSTLIAWLIVIVAVVIAVETSGKSAMLLERARAAIEVTGTTRLIVVAALLLSAAVASTWKHLVQSLCIGLTGRPWLIKCTVLLTLSVFMAVGPVLDRLADSQALQSAIWNGLPWILAALAAVKAAAAIGIAVRLAARNVLSERALVAGAVSWLAAVATLYGVLVWLAASPVFPRYFLGAMAILPVPLARIAAAPLALVWSRHR